MRPPLRRDHLDSRGAESGGPVQPEREVVGSEEIAWTVRKLFERLAAERPVVVAFEDIHWVEPTPLDVVEHLVDSLP